MAADQISRLRQFTHRHAVNQHGRRAERTDQEHIGIVLDTDKIVQPPHGINPDKTADPCKEDFRQGFSRQFPWATAPHFLKIFFHFHTLKTHAPVFNLKRI